MALTVKPENRDKFESAMRKWKLLIDVIGWDELCVMCIDRTPPFQDRPTLDSQTKNSAKLFILKLIGADLRENGLEGAMEEQK